MDNLPFFEPLVEDHVKDTSTQTYPHHFIEKNICPLHCNSPVASIMNNIRTQYPQRKSKPKRRDLHFPPHTVSTNPKPRCHKKRSHARHIIPCKTSNQHDTVTQHDKKNDLNLTLLTIYIIIPLIIIAIILLHIIFI